MLGTLLKISTSLFLPDTLNGTNLISLFEFNTLLTFFARFSIDIGSESLPILNNSLLPFEIEFSIP